MLRAVDVSNPQKITIAMGAYSMRSWDPVSINNRQNLKTASRASGIWPIVGSLTRGKIRRTRGEMRLGLGSPAVPEERCAANELPSRRCRLARSTISGLSPQRYFTMRAPLPPLMFPWLIDRASAKSSTLTAAPREGWGGFSVRSWARTAPMAMVRVRELLSFS